MLEIKVRSKRYNCDLKLEHKVSVIVGDSGKGKSWLVRALLDDSKGYDVTLSEDVQPILIDSRTWHMFLTGCHKKTPLFIIDDEDFVFNGHFGETFNKFGKCYLIIILRTKVNKYKLGRMNTISVNDDSIYEFVANGIEHTICPSVMFKSNNVESDDYYDLILREGYKAYHL